MKNRPLLTTTILTGAMGPKLPPFVGDTSSRPIATMAEPGPGRGARLVRTARRWVYAAAPAVLLAATVVYAATDPKIPEAAGD